MRFHILLLGEFKSIITKKAALLILLVTGLALSFYSFYLMYGSVQYTIKMFFSSKHCNTYTIENHNTDNNDIYKNIDVLLKKGLRTALMMTITDDKPMLIGYLGDDSRWFMQSQGSFFSDEHYENGINSAIIPDILYPYPDVNFSNYNIKYEDNEFSVIGLIVTTNNRIYFFAGCEDIYEKYYPSTQENTYTDNEHDHNHDDEHEHYKNNIKETKISKQCIIIPYTTYETLNYKPDIVRLEFTVTSLSVREKIKNELAELFPNEEIIMPEASNYSYTTKMWIALLKSIGICIASLINIIGLFVYLLEYRISAYKVYYLVGARFRDIIALNILCWLTVLGVSFIISRLLMRITEPIVKMLHIYSELTLIQGFTIYITSFFISFILLFPYLYRMRRLKT